MLELDAAEVAMPQLNPVTLIFEVVPQRLLLDVDHRNMVLADSGAQ